jgi:hypothetical protein
MHKDQFGFVKGRSTEHALSATVNKIEKGLHRKEFVITTLSPLGKIFFSRFACLSGQTDGGQSRGQQ